MSSPETGSRRRRRLIAPIGVVRQSSSSNRALIQLLPAPQTARTNWLILSNASGLTTDWWRKWGTLPILSDVFGRKVIEVTVPEKEPDHAEGQQARHCGTSHRTRIRRSLRRVARVHRWVRDP